MTNHNVVGSTGYPKPVTMRGTRVKWKRVNDRTCKKAENYSKHRKAEARIRSWTGCPFWYFLQILEVVWIQKPFREFFTASLALVISESSEGTEENMQIQYIATQEGTLHLSMSMIYVAFNGGWASPKYPMLLSYSRPIPSTSNVPAVGQKRGQQAARTLVDLQAQRNRHDCCYPTDLLP